MEETIFTAGTKLKKLFSVNCKKPPEEENGKKPSIDPPLVETHALAAAGNSQSPKPKKKKKPSKFSKNPSHSSQNQNQKVHPNITLPNCNRLFLPSNEPALCVEPTEMRSDEGLQDSSGSAEKAKPNTIRVG